MRAVLVVAGVVLLSFHYGSSFYVPLAITLAGALAAYLFFTLLRNYFKVRNTAIYFTTTPADVYTKPGSKRTRKNVCVIGAGPSGIVAVKELLEEGHTVTCVEKYHDIGGVFLYDKEKGGAYDSTLLTISNYLMAYSDFPPQNNEPYKFWHHSEYFDYLKKYIDHNMLYERANWQFNSMVEKVERDGANWRVVYKNIKTNETTETMFDAVAVCNGINHTPFLPTLKGQETSPIVIRHSATYKSAATDPDLKGKRVICMGIGETGADVSAEVAEHAGEAYLSMRRPPHVVSRNHWGMGLPADVFSTRAMFYSNIMYIDFLHHQDRFLKAQTAGPIGKKIFNGYLGLGSDVSAKIADLSVRSRGGVSDQFLCKNDRFIPYLINGKLIEKPDVERLEGKTVHFTDGSFVEDVDTIIMSTGFYNYFPFLPENLQTRDARAMYKHTFHPNCDDASLIFLGYVRPSTGGIPAASEATARYWSLILSNQRKLPDNWKERIAPEGQAERDFLHLSKAITGLSFWGAFMENMACHIDCQPKLLSYLFTNPSMWISLYFGPLIAAQFRLRGPHSKPALAKQLLTSLPVVTPTPFLVAQSITSMISIIGGTVFKYRPPMW